MLFAAAAVAGGLLAAAGPETFMGLAVQPENRCSAYQVADYHYNRPRLLRLLVARDGNWLRYTDRLFENAGDVDIEHIVARREAHDSGLCAADPATRARFASDLLNQVLAGAHLNRHEKGGKDAGEWQPPRNRCWFASAVVAVKREYGLTVDARERDALAVALEGCSLLRSRP